MKTNKEKEKNSAQSYCSFLSSRTSDKGKVQVFNEETRILKQQTNLIYIYQVNISKIIVINSTFSQQSMATNHYKTKTSIKGTCFCCGHCSPFCIPKCGISWCYSAAMVLDRKPFGSLFCGCLCWCDQSRHFTPLYYASDQGLH